MPQDCPRGKNNLWTRIWSADCTTIGMSLKNAVFLALVASVLLTILLLFALVNDSVGVARGLIPAMRLPVAVIEAFAGVSSVILLYVFYRDQH